MATYKVIAGAHGMGGKIYRVGNRFENGGGIEQAEHFSRCFKKVASTVVSPKAKPDDTVLKEAQAVALAKAKAKEIKAENKALEAEAKETAKAGLAAQAAKGTESTLTDEEKAAKETAKVAEALNAKLKVFGWPKMAAFPITSPEMKKYFRTVKGKAFLNTEYGKNLVADLRKTAKDSK